MYNGKYVIPGLIIFVALFTCPFWLNLLTPAYAKPELAYPAGQKECVESVEFMRAEHMQVLNVWRDKVVREGKREYTAANGKKWNVSLQNTCMDCHSNKAEFCDKCHDSANVTPYCWDCHLEPKGNE